MGLEVAINLLSKIGDEDLASDLLALRRRVQKSDYDYNHFRALSQLVIDSASDIDVWSAVFNLISAVARVTPPRSIALSFDDTPSTRSTSSLEGSEQTRKNLDPELFFEIKGCTHRNVDGFFGKFFEGQSWSRQSKKVCTRMKTQHKRGRWTGFPDPPEQDAVWKWLSRFQNRHLRRSRGIFYTTDSTSDLTGGEAKRQVDILLKDRIDKEDPKYERPLSVFIKTRSNGGEKHNWKDVRVVGELKRSERWLKGDFKAGLLQLTRYIRDIFIAQPTRRFIYGFLLCGTLMEL